jgi:alanyl-tRNA synthetase
LMRKLVREMLTSQMLLAIDDPDFIPALMQQALNLYADRQPQLLSTQRQALNYVAAEQNRFEHTLAKGRRRLDRMLNRRGGRAIGPQEIFDLEKRHGVPQSLLDAILVQQNVDLGQLAYLTVALRDNNE